MDMFGIEKEVLVFIQAILAGNLVCLVYCFLRVLRRIIKHNLFFVSVEDILFWICTGIYLFVQMYKTSDGMIRWYFVIGVLLGGVCTYCFVMKLVKKYVAKWKKKE